MKKSSLSRASWLWIAFASVPLLGLWVTGCPGNNPGDDGDPPVVVDEPPSGEDLPPVVVDIIKVDLEGSGDVEQKAAGSFVRLTAMADEGWRFVGWSGSVTSQQNPLTILPSESTSVTATFVALAPEDETDGGTVEFDQDGDGVADDTDLCPESILDADVDSDGCSADQRDSDGDGVVDRADQCADTEVNAPVNSQGCSAAQRDTDGDGVKDDSDQCPSTGVGVVVLPTGCTATIADQDGDGVPNDRDRCPETLAGVTVDTNGCPPPPPPVCGNQLVETGEQCDPPNSVLCDANCRFRVSSTPLCGNSVVETGEECDPPNQTDCTAACLRPAANLCGNNVVDTAAGEQCDPPNGTTCSTTCRTVSTANPMCGNSVVEPGEQCDSQNRMVCGCDCKLIVSGVPRCGNCHREQGEECDPPSAGVCGTNCIAFSPAVSPVCGNSVVEIGESCDPPVGTTCDAQCQVIIPRPTNNRCATAITVGAGRRSFDTTLATAEGPPVALEDCASSSFGADVWYCYVSPSTTQVTIDTCESDFDTILAVYLGCGCPTTPAIGCNDDSDRCPSAQRNGSQLTFTALANHGYLIRVGGAGEHRGEGTLRISPRPSNDDCLRAISLNQTMFTFSNENALTDGPDPAGPDCPAGAFQKDIWYCLSAPCSGVTTVDLCESGLDTMLAVHPGCQCPVNSALVCHDDCSTTALGSQVMFNSVFGQPYLLRIGGFQGAEGAGQAVISCVLGDTCGPGNGDCHLEHDNPGCEDEECCSFICDTVDITACCESRWGEECVKLAQTFCP